MPGMFTKGAIWAAAITLFQPMFGGALTRAQSVILAESMEPGQCQQVRLELTVKGTLKVPRGEMLNNFNFYFLVICLPLLCESTSKPIPLHNTAAIRKFEMVRKYTLSGKRCIVTGGTQVHACVATSQHLRSLLTPPFRASEQE